jgi:hypothetical protein
MAVAAPRRQTAPAPAPSRTAPPPKRAAPARPAPQKKAAPARRPRTRPTPKGRAAAAPATPARKSPARKSPTRKSTGRKPAARQAPARTPRRARPASRAAAVGGQLIPLAGRTAVAVGQLPDSGLMVRMTRGRAWIAVLGVLLAGIVSLNVITLSFAASSGRIDEQTTTLEEENGVLGSRDATLSGIGRTRAAAGAIGLAMPSSEDIHFTDAGPGDVATAAQRLAAAGG